MIARVVVMEVSALEAAHLAGLVRQFTELLESSDLDAGDPAVARLTPDAYRGDAEASAEFRRLTGADLLERRRQDATVVLSSLEVDDETAGFFPGTDDDSAERTLVVTLDPEETAAWMRTLTALRLVLASRLGIESEDDHDGSDPRLGVYEWLGMRLEGLIDAAERNS